MAKELSSKRRRLFWRTANRVCVCCGTRENLTIDHILARSLGGTNDFANLAVMCYACNQAKAVGEKAIHEQRQRELADKTTPADPKRTTRLSQRETADEFTRLMQD